MNIIKPHLALSRRVFVFLILVALCLLTCGGCDNFYDALKFGEENADGGDGLAGGDGGDDSAESDPTDDLAGGSPADDLTGDSPADDLGGSNPIDDLGGGNPADDLAGGDPVDDLTRSNLVNDVEGGNLALIRLVDLDHFSITVDDGAPLPTPTEMLEDATQFTMASDGFVTLGESGSMEVQTDDIVMVQGSSQTGTATIIRPHDHDDDAAGLDAADGVDVLAEGTLVLIRLVDLDHFSITVDDGAPLPTPTEVLEDTTQFTMASGGLVHFGESGSIEVQTDDIVIVQGSSQTGTVTIIQPAITPPTPQ